MSFEQNGGRSAKHTFPRYQVNFPFNFIYLLFHFSRWYSELHSVPFDAEKANKDSTLSQLQSFFDQAQRHVRDKIYITMPNLKFPSEISHQLAKRLWQKGEQADDGGGGIGQLNKKYKVPFLYSQKYHFW
jgi:hypothetical protein